MRIKSQQVKSKLKKRGIQSEVESAGFESYHINEPPDPRAVKIAKERGIDITENKCRLFVADDFDNFDVICNYINRETEHVMKFLLNELGTAGKIEGNRAIFQGRFPREEVERQIQKYVDEYVLCMECKKPDTHIIKMERVWVLKCDACGAIRPIMKRKR